VADKKISHIAWIWGIWRERKGLIALLALLTLMSSAVAVAYPYLTKVLFDTLQRLLSDGAGGAGSMAEIRRLALLVIGVGLVGLVSSFFPGVRSAVNTICDYMIRERYFGIVMDKDYRFFAAFRSGDIVTRLTDDIYDFPKLSWFLCSGIFRAVESISKVGFCLAAMLLLDWKLTLLSLIPLPLLIAVFAITQDRIYDTFRRNQEAISDINSQLEMSFSGVRIIKAYACEGKYERFFSDALARRFGTEMAVAKLETVLQMIYMYIDRVMLIGVVFIGGYMAAAGRISVGTFLAFYGYLGMLVYPILDIPQLFVSGKRAFVNIDRLEEMRGFPSRDQSRASVGTKAPESSAPPASTRDVSRIEAKGLSFSYEGRADTALSDVSFGLSRGEKLAVIGPVGSGKTTLVKLLGGLLDPSSGRILVDGEDEEGGSGARLSSILAYVPQEALLFSGTIRQNVAFGAPGDGTSIDDATFAHAISIAQLSEEIASFPAGEATLLGQRGVSVSGGQRQRIAIARAIARAPRLLLLDDITASLDASNEERLMRALDAWSRDLTCVIVSHRLSTIQYADKVLFLEGGKVAAFGAHEELLVRNHAYAAFIEEQMSMGDEETAHNPA
jgi:ATP-binding cassette subfamily B multidrug efflux pump